MQYPFWFAGRTAGVKDVERIFGIHRLGRAICIDILHFPMPPGIPAFLDVNLVVGPAENDDSLDLLVVL